MIGRIVRPLDRYVFGEFWKIFVATALGFPLLVIVIDLTDHLQGYLDKKIPMRDLVLSYVYWIPDSMFMVLPAAVLFATVFAIGAFTRHAEVTAAKASGISFYRMVMPIFFASLIACGMDIGLGEIAPRTNKRRSELLGEDKTGTGGFRFNFAYSGEFGRVYKVTELRADSGRIHGLQIERKGKGANYPTYVLAADSAMYRATNSRHPWVLAKGALNLVNDTGKTLTVSFQAAYDKAMIERPLEMMTKSPDPKNMRYREITRFITAIERSGGDANLSRVERALKIAVPVTCIIIALFGAPLATSTQRGGSAYGVGVSLATTMIFLLMIQLTRAIGGKGVIPPDYAAWIPGAIFAVIGLVLLARVRT
jgi:lipopolysaccharide export system permease protein